MLFFAKVIDPKKVVKPELTDSLTVSDKRFIWFPL